MSNMGGDIFRCPSTYARNHDGFGHPDRPTSRSLFFRYAVALKLAPSRRSARRAGGSKAVA
jgi:hypothetical protein